MATLIAWGNIHQPYDFNEIPPDARPARLRAENAGYGRVRQRHQCRRLAHFLLWRLCRKLPAFTPALLTQIYRTASGRPQWPWTNMDFNISHSGDWAAVILNAREQGPRTRTAVGIDIESPHKPRRFLELLTRFAAPDEIAWFKAQAEPEAAFYRTWCLREAVLKSQGVGIVKLSEVMHDPRRLTLQSAYCPQGRLLFSADLPFYFAAFAAGDALLRAQYFQWENGVLVPYSPANAEKYSVNF